ncbi:MAG: hypothetical protein EOO47_02560 [Flavobacterium sp.]|nr:MAG: hypothetical protein EOO47_02560 [Flavobacterium sp.]
MKKILLLLFVTVFAIASTYGQAYKDLQSLKNINIDKIDSIAKISDIIIPYFTSDGIVHKDRIKAYLKGGLGDRIVNYLNNKSKDLEVIKKFAFETNGKILEPYFKSIQADLDELNNIQAKYSTIIPNLTEKFLLSNIAESYTNKTLENKLFRQRKLEEMDLTQDSVLFAELATLRQDTKASDLNAIQDLLKQLSELSNFTTRIAVNKAEVHKILDSPDHLKLLNDLYTYRRNSPEAQTPANAELNKQTALKAVEVVLTQSTANINGNHLVSTLSSMRLPSQADMIDALVIFIAKRFSQEVALTFLDALKQKSKTTVLIADLFPATFKLLAEGNNYEMPRLGSIWHYAIAQDINNIPLNLGASKFIKDKIEKSRFAGYYPMFQDVVSMAELAKSGNSLPEILLMYNGGMVTFTDKQLQFAFEVMNLVNNEFATKQDPNFYWLKWNNLAALTNTDWDLMVKMIASKYSTKLFGNNRFSLPLDNFEDPKWVAFRKNMQQALMVLNQFEERRLALINKSISGQGTAVKTISFWECQQQLFNVLLNPNIIEDKQIASATKFLQSTLQIYKLQEENNHPAMIRESIQLVQNLFPKESGKLSELILKNWRVAKEKHLPVYKKVDSYVSALDQLLIDLSNLETTDEVRKGQLIADLSANFKWNITGVTYAQQKKEFADLMTVALKKADKNGDLIAVKGKNAVYKLLTMADEGSLKTKLYVEGKSSGSLTVVLKTAEFFTDVMGASNSTQLSEVIKAYAAPPQSYKLRRNSRFSVDIDAHIGVYGGGEWIGREKLESLNAKPFAPVWGLSAPVGFSFSWGYRHTTGTGEQISFLNRYGTPKTLSGNSYSLGISLIDIAAPLAYRLSNDEEEALPRKLSWAQVFSPGLHLRFGLKNTPLAFSLGGQYTPQLRKSSLDLKDQQAYRAYAGLFFDMPLFNIYKR